MLRRLLPVLVLGLLLSLPPATWAHVGVRPAEAPANATRTFAFAIPHGCSGQATTSVALRVPAGAGDVQPRPKPGWDLAVETDADGATIATWSGGSFPDDQTESFRVRLTTPPTPDTELYIPTVQECTDGRYRWIQIPGDGKRYEDLATPAPRILLGALTAPEDATTTTPETTAETTTTAPVVEPEPEPLSTAQAQGTTVATVDAPVTDDTGDGPALPNPLLIGAILVAATASVLVGIALARRRP